MKSHLPAILLSAVLLAYPGTPARAQTNPAAESRLNREELIRLALSADPVLASYRQDRIAAGAVLDGARSHMGPTLSLRAGAVYLSDAPVTVPAGSLGQFPPTMGGARLPDKDTTIGGEDNDFRYDIRAVLKQTVFAWGKVVSGIRAAESGGRAADFQVLARELELKTTLVSTLESLAVLERMIAAAQAQSVLVQRLEAITADSLEEGFVLETAYSKVRNRAREIRLNLSSLITEQARLLLSLERLTGLGNLTLRQLELPDVSENPEPPGFETLPDEAELLAGASTSNPSVQALAALAESADSQAAAARGGTLGKPDLAIQGEFAYKGGFTREPDSLDGAWTVTLGLQTHLFDSGLSSASRREAEARASAAHLRRQDAAAELTYFIRSSLVSMALHRENMDYFQDVINADLAKAAEARLSWESGYGREDEWIRAELSRLTAEQQRWAEVSAYYRLDRQIRAAAGLDFQSSF